MPNHQIISLLQKKSEERQRKTTDKSNELIELLKIEFPEAFHPNIYHFISKINNYSFTGPIGNIQNPELGNTYRYMLSEVVSQSGNSAIISEINKTLNLRNEMAFKADCTDGRRVNILEKINEIRQIQIQNFSDIIGCSYGEELSKRVNEVKNSYPNQDVELIVLKRHEVCSNAAKGYGFYKDADLDAVQGLGNQSLEELYSAKQVQTASIEWLNIIGSHMPYVDMKVSPVSRAVSTALLATYDRSKVNEIMFDSNMAEKQWSLKAICSGQASIRPSQYANYMQRLGFYSTSVGNDELFEGETTDAFKQRLDNAVKQISKPSDRVSSNLRVNITVGHGDMHKAIIGKIFEKFNISGPISKLSYGEQYVLVGVRNPNTKELNHVEYLGIYNRYGNKNAVDQQCRYYQEYLALDNENDKKNYIVTNKDALLDNLPLLVMRDRGDVDSINLLLMELLKSQKQELATRSDNPNSPNCVNSSTTYLRYLAYYFKQLENFVSGKAPKTQQDSLDSLDGLVNDDDVALDSLKKFHTEVRQKLNEGKVTKLIKAFIDYKEFTQSISPENSARATLRR